MVRQEETSEAGEDEEDRGKGTFHRRPEEGTTETTEVWDEDAGEEEEEVVVMGEEGR